MTRRAFRNAGLPFHAAWAGILVALCGSPALAADPAPKVTNNVYKCDDNKIVVVEQLVAPKTDSPIAVTFGYDRHDMKPAASASGTRHLSGDGELEWWSKGDEGHLAAVPGGAKLAANCRRVKPAA